ncbi:MAG: hypothetical protein IPG96_11780 [Proteobacteria bacterium]|nr:hypothetical protein [Pseudomonadota bacterium]
MMVTERRHAATIRRLDKVLPKCVDRRVLDRARAGCRFGPDRAAKQAQHGRACDVPCVGRGEDNVRRKMGFGRTKEEHIAGANTACGRCPIAPITAVAEWREQASEVRFKPSKY